MAGELPLRGMRVVDMADEKAEICGRILADLGADVVRVEPPEGAASRRLPPFHGDASLYFAVRNANKRAVRLDVTDPEGRQRLLGLLSDADVWIETTRPGTLAACGLAPGDVAARVPRLVVLSVTDFGQTGPYRDYEATDAVMVTIAGALFRSGVPERPPLLPPGAFAYDVAGVTGAFAALAAYWQREATGRGQHLDLSVMEAVAQVSDWGLPNFSAISRNGGLYGEIRGGSGPVYPLYPCADGHVRLVVLSPRQWRALRAWLGEPEILQDDHWDQLLSRMSIQGDILDPMYEELFRDKTMVELSAEAQRRGIVMTPVLHPAAVLDAEHFLARGSFAPLEVAAGVKGPVASGFFEIDGARIGPRSGVAAGDAAWVADAAWVGGPPPSGAPPAADEEPSLPFRGLRVLDFGHGGVGVEAGRLFAEYGADVIKVESRSYPDFIRTVAGSEMSPSFASSSRSKRSFGVNVKSPEGLDLITRLVVTADVLIENNSAGTMDEMGLGWETLHALNPRLVMVSSQLMGSHGPWKDWRGYGPSTRPVGGMTYLWNFPDRSEPPGAMVIHPDHLAGRLCAVGAIAALAERERTGVGRHVEVPQVETVLNLLADLFLKEGLEPGSVGPQGNRNDRGAPWGLYPCAGEQRWCAVTCRDDEDWSRLVTALGAPEWARDPALATVEGRRARHDEVDARLGEWTSERTDREVMELLQAHRVPAAMMEYASDQPDDPHLQARGYLRDIDQPGVGEMTLEGPAFAATGMADPVITPAPALGADTRAIAAELGLYADEIDKLFAVGVLEETAGS